MGTSGKSDFKISALETTQMSVQVPQKKIFPGASPSAIDRKSVV